MCQSSDGQTVRRSDGRRVGRGRGHLTVRPSDRPSVLLQDLRHHAGAHRPPTLADREAQPLVHRDRRDQLDRHLDVVPRHHHLHPRRQLHRPRHVRRPEVELRPVPLEERRVPPPLLLRQHVHLRLELPVRRDRPRLRQHHPPAPFALLNPTTATSAPTFARPRSIRPVATVPRPVIENTSSTGIRNALSVSRTGCGMNESSALQSSSIFSTHCLSPLSAPDAEPRITGASSPGKSYLLSSSRTSSSTGSRSSGSSTRSHLLRNTTTCGTLT